MKVIATFIVGTLAATWMSMVVAEEDAPEFVVEAQLTPKQIHFREFKRQLALAKARWATAAPVNYKFRAYEVGIQGSWEYEVTLKNGVCTIRNRVRLGPPARFGRPSACKGSFMTDMLSFLSDHGWEETYAEFDETYGYVRSISMTDFGYHVTEFSVLGSPNPSLERP